MKRWTRDTWLDHGLKQLAGQGLPGIAIEPLCEAAGKTTGSFYHHFTDHPAFLIAVIERWETLATDRIIQSVEARESGSAMSALSDLAFGIDPSIEVRIRQLADNHDQAARSIAGVDKKRLDYLETLYQKEVGATGELSGDLARLDYAAFIGFIMIGQNWQPGTAQRLPKLLAKMTEAFLEAQ